MLRNIIRYIALALVIIGIVIVMRSLFKNSGSKWTPTNNDSGYIVTIKLLDKDTKEFVNGGKLVLKNKNGKVIDEWTTENKSHIVSKVTKGTYTLEQIKVTDDYKIIDDKITFKVENKDKDIIMYNTKNTKEENSNKEETPKETNNENKTENNTTASDVQVDNTLSVRSSLTYIISLIILIVGTTLIIQTKRCYNK